MTRTFDPRFADALREELAARADAVRDAPAPVRRRQWPVVAVTAAAVGVVAVVLVGVLPAGVHRSAEPVPGSSPSAPALVDPRTMITDPGSPEFLAPDIHALIERRGTSSATMTFRVPSGVDSVDAYLSCTGDGGFHLAVEGKDFWTECSPVPLHAGFPATSGSRTVGVQVPAGTRWSLLVIPTPTGSTTYGTLIVTQSPPIRRPPHDS